VTLTLDATTARTWIERWDAQQEVYLPDREERFTALIDAVAEAAGCPAPLVVDLGCGPGSLSVRLLRQLPEATVVAVDADPLLLGLGRLAHEDLAGSLTFTELDLGVPGWSAALGLDRAADAAVSTTALHWLQPADLAAMYAELATILRPGGILLNGDHLTENPETAPTLARLSRALVEREDSRRAPEGHAEDWTAWWTAAKADPVLADLVAARDRMKVAAHDGSPSGQLSVQVDALRAAGFAEVGTLWQRGDSRLLCAVR
jgi:SAM-dependent methyltransferase